MTREFILTVAEYHQAKYRVQADSLQEAIKSFNTWQDANKNEPEMIDGSVEYIEIDEERGRNGLLEVTDSENNEKYFHDKEPFETAWRAALYDESDS